MTTKSLTKIFYSQSSPDTARQLIGKHLVRNENGKKKVIMITETEAYDGIKDKASHAFKGKTARTEVMFGEPGIFYVYLCYGMYYMLNVVTGKKNYPSAVLIRGGIVLIGGKADVKGPGKVTKFLNVDKSFNNKTAGRETGLWIEDRGKVIGESQILTTGRVGIDYAGHYWSRRKWRFILRS